MSEFDIEKSQFSIEQLDGISYFNPEAKLISKTVGSEELRQYALAIATAPALDDGIDGQEVVSFVARVSNPNNQLNFDTAAGLLRYCIKHEHWSIFEHAYVTLELSTTRAISPQVLRHRSFTFQEFSQRYADASMLTQAIPIPRFRKQDTKNRQNSTDDLDPFVKQDFEIRTKQAFDMMLQLYQDGLEAGIAKECMREVLPLAVPTRMYMTGNLRSWIHYTNLRTSNGTQLEHMNLAKQCQCIIAGEFPDVAEALGWTHVEPEITIETTNP